jgi:hypothetical protein
MTRLSQIIAVEKGAKADADRARAKAAEALQKAPQLSGISRTYQPRDEDGDQLPPESTNVQVKAEDVLETLAASLTRLLDVTLTKDAANTVAAADVVAEGRVLLTAVPVPYLLFLEKQLAELHALMGRLPLLDPAEEWAEDAASGSWRTPVTRTVRNKKLFRNHVLAEATKEHPAQVQVYTEDVPAGDWATVKFSGALPAARARVLAERVAELQRAVKFAREEANATEITDKHAGEAIFGYLLRGVG